MKFKVAVCTYDDNLKSIDQEFDIELAYQDMQSNNPPKQAAAKAINKVAVYSVTASDIQTLGNTSMFQCRTRSGQHYIIKVS